MTIISQVRDNKKGMTLIETMIAIVIIIGLVIVLMIVLNPQELFKKSSDSRNLGIAREITAAIVRNNIYSGTYPWYENNDFYTARIRRSDGAYEYDPTDPDQDMAWIYNLVTANELKKSSAESIMEQKKWYIIKPSGNADSVWTCINPESEANIAKAAADCDEKNGTFGRKTPARVNNLEPCDTIDGSLPLKELGERNLLCTQE